MKSRRENDKKVIYILPTHLFELAAPTFTDPANSSLEYVVSWFATPAFTVVKRHLYPANSSPEKCCPWISGPGLKTVVRRHLFLANPSPERVLSKFATPAFRFIKPQEYEDDILHEKI